MQREKEEYIQRKLAAEDKVDAFLSGNSPKGPTGSVAMGGQARAAGGEGGDDAGGGRSEAAGAAEENTAEGGEAAGGETRAGTEESGERGGNAIEGIGSRSSVRTDGDVDEG